MSKPKRPKLNACLDIGKFKICIPKDCKLPFVAVGDDEPQIPELLEQQRAAGGAFDLIAKPGVGDPPCGCRPNDKPCKCHHQEQKRCGCHPDDPCRCGNDRKAGGNCPPETTYWSRWGPYFAELRRRLDENELLLRDRDRCVQDCGKFYVLRGRLAIEHACWVHRRVARHLLRLPNVTATDVGFAVVEQGHEFESVLAIRVHVESKLSRRQIRETGLTDLTSTWFGRKRLARQHTKAERKALAPSSDHYCCDPLEPDWHCYCPPCEFDLNGRPQKPGDPCGCEQGKPGHCKHCGRPICFCGHCHECCRCPRPRPEKPPAAKPCEPCKCCGRPICLCGCCHPRCCCKDFGQSWEGYIDGVDRYGIPGVVEDDLSIYVYEDPKTAREEGNNKAAAAPGHPSDHDLRKWRKRLCICGVPVDIVSSRYFPSTLRPDDGSGVFVDALKTGRELTVPELLVSGRGRSEPLVGGLSIGTTTGQAGTLGVVVWDRTDGTPCILSNWHVLAGTPSAQVGQPIYQPALFDGGTTNDKVAELKRWHLGELGDAALAELDNHRSYATGEVSGLWNPVSDYQKPQLNMVVEKWGRTTGFTQGFIDGIHLATSIDYGFEVKRFFKNQIHIAPLYSGQDVSQVGDSGSLVVVTKKPFELIDAIQFFLGELEDCIDAANKAELIDKFKCYKDEIGEEPADLEEFARFLMRGKVPGGVDRHEHHDDKLAEALRRLGYDVRRKQSNAADLKNRRRRRVYFAVALIFAGDTPGSPFGEFALASPLEPLAKELSFALRPVFEPRSSFRKVRKEAKSNRPVGGGPDVVSALSPGNAGRDPRGGGPQPDIEPRQTGPGT